MLANQDRLVPLEEMQARFGEESIWVYNILRGTDHSEGTSFLLLRLMMACLQCHMRSANCP